MATIDIWPGVTADRSDPLTHFWFTGMDGRYRRACDPHGGTTDTIAETLEYTECNSCFDLYVDDIVSGEGRLVVALPNP